MDIAVLVISLVAEGVSVIFFSALSKSDEKLRAEKNNTGGAPAPALYRMRNENYSEPIGRVWL